MKKNKFLVFIVFFLFTIFSASAEDFRLVGTWLLNVGALHHDFKLVFDQTGSVIMSGYYIDKNGRRVDTGTLQGRYMARNGNIAIDIISYGDIKGGFDIKYRIYRGILYFDNFAVNMNASRFDRRVLVSNYKLTGATFEKVPEIAPPVRKKVPKIAPPVINNVPQATPVPLIYQGERWNYALDNFKLSIDFGSRINNLDLYIEYKTFRKIIRIQLKDANYTILGNGSISITNAKYGSVVYDLLIEIKHGYNNLVIIKDAFVTIKWGNDIDTIQELENGYGMMKGLQFQLN